MHSVPPLPWVFLLLKFRARLSPLVHVVSFSCVSSAFDGAGADGKRQCSLLPAISVSFLSLFSVCFCHIVVEKGIGLSQ